MDNLINALNDCLEKIQSGATIDQVIEAYPGLKEELRALLETAQAAKSLRFEQTVPIPAAVRNRSRFLSQAEKMVNARNHPNRGTSFRSSAALVYGVIICLVLVLGTGIASAQSIPGDIFYPVKLAGEQTRLFLENNPVDRISLEENYDRQRAQETDNLMQRERLIETTFAGFLTRPERDQWTIAGIRVMFPSNLQSQAQEMRGKYIEVKGLPQSSGIFMVEDIHLRQFEITGTIDSIQSDQWVVSQMNLGVSSDTQITGQPTIGGNAKMTVIRTEDDQLLAISIEAINTNRSVDQTSTQLSRPTNVIRPAQNTPASIGSASNDKLSGEKSSNENAGTIQKTPAPAAKENSDALSPTQTQQPTHKAGEDGQDPTRTFQKTATPGAPNSQPTPTAENTPRHHESDQDPRPTQQQKDPTHTPEPGYPHDDSGH